MFTFEENVFMTNVKKNVLVKPPNPSGSVCVCNRTSAHLHHTNTHTLITDRCCTLLSLLPQIQIINITPCLTHTHRGSFKNREQVAMETTDKRE